VHSIASGARNIDTLFLMLRSDRYRLNKRHARTYYAELMFLHLEGSTGHGFHSESSGAHVTPRKFKIEDNLKSFINCKLNQMSDAFMSPRICFFTHVLP
jgi:hypothetical protein